MRPCRLFNLARKTAPFSLQKLPPFSATAVATLGSSNYFTDEEEDGFSSVHRNDLKFQRPPTRRSTGLRFNSVSFIGSVCLPSKIITTRMGQCQLGVIATLDVVKKFPELEDTLR